MSGGREKSANQIIALPQRSRNHDAEEGMVVPLCRCDGREGIQLSAVCVGVKQRQRADTVTACPQFVFPTTAPCLQSLIQLFAVSALVTAGGEKKRIKI